MSRRKFISIYVISLLIISIAVIGLGSWLIIPTSSAAATHPTVNPEDVDTSPCFETEFIFSGTALSKTDIALNATGDDVYGADLDYSVEWVGGKLLSNDADLASYDKAFRGVAAGTHYYKITDNTTGQIICNAHEVSIAQDTFKLKDTTIAASSYGFVGDAVSWTITLVGVNSNKEFTFTQNYNVKLSDYVPSANMLHTNTSLTNQSVRNNYGSIPGLGTTYTDINFNNFELPSTSLTYNLTFGVLPTVFTSTGATSSGRVKGTYKNANNEDIETQTETMTHTVSTYYANLEQALTATASATTATMVVPMQSFTYDNVSYGNSGDTTVEYSKNYSHVLNPTSKVATIGANVTLFVPYEGGTSSLKIVHYDHIKGVNAYGVAKYVKNLVTIGDGVQVTNSGKIIVSGVVSGGGGGYSNNSITGGNHAVINMGAGAGITSTNDITCFGFITESSLNNGSTITVDSGTLNVIFTVTEHRGGGVFMGMANPTSEKITAALNKELDVELTVFPLNRFYVQSVTSKIVMTSSASCIGTADLYANSSNNITTIDLVAPSTSALIQTSDGTVVEMKYNPTTQVHDIDIYGNATVGSLQLSLVVNKAGQTITVNLSSDTVLLPISHHLDINLKPYKGGGSATVDSTGQDIKVLPGGSVTVDENVTFNITNLAVYENNTLLSSPRVTVGGGSTGVAASSYTNNTPGIFEVKGTVNVANVGGYIEVDSASAKVNISESTTICSPEIVSTHSANLEIFLGGVKLTDMGYNASVYSTDAESTIVATSDMATGSTTQALEPLRIFDYDAITVSGDYVLYDPIAVITFDTQGGAINESTLEVDASFSGTSVTEIPELYKPSKSGYEFDGWFMDADCTVPYDPTAIVFDTTVYAKWKLAVTASITYTVPAHGGTGPYTSVSFDAQSPTLVGSFTTYNETANGNNINFSRYISKWVAAWTITTESGTTTFSVEYSKNQTVAIADVLASQSISADDVTALTCEMTANWEDKHVISSSITNVDMMSSAAITVVINGTTLSYKKGETTSGTVYAKPGDTVSIKTTSVGIKVSGGTLADLNGAKMTISGVTSNGISKSHTRNNYTEEIVAETGTFDPLNASSLSIGATIEGYRIGNDTCITGDTLITLADGSQKRIDQIAATDIILVWNFFTGEYDTAYGSIIMNHGYGDFEIINLKFSDGTVVKVINSHGFFDEEENDFVFITKNNVDDYLGHRFLKNTANGFETVTLYSYEITAKYTESYSILTAEHYNCMLENMFTVTEAEVHAVFLTPYDIGDDLKYDEAKMQADIEKYGLYTYDEFAHLLTKEEFNALNLKHFKVAVGKGLITYEEILFLIELHFGD